jgi:hypothetical protein
MFRIEATADRRFLHNLLVFIEFLENFELLSWLNRLEMYSERTDTVESLANVNFSEPRTRLLSCFPSSPGHCFEFFTLQLFTETRANRGKTESEMRLHVARLLFHMQRHISRMLSSASTSSSSF